MENSTFILNFPSGYFPNCSIGTWNPKSYQWFHRTEEKKVEFKIVALKRRRSYTKKELKNIHRCPLVSTAEYKIMYE